MTRSHLSLAAASAALFIAAAAVVPFGVSAAGSPPGDPVYGTVTVTGSQLPGLTQSVASGAVADPAVGVAVPVVSGADYDGRPVTIDPATQGATLVVLISHWCSHCNVMVDLLAEWRREAAAPKDVRVVGVSVAADPDKENFPPAEWLDSDADWRWPVIADDARSSALFAYGGVSFPMFVFVSSSGTLVWRVDGEMPIDELAALVDEGLAAER